MDVLFLTNNDKMPDAYSISSVQIRQNKKKTDSQRPVEQKYCAPILHVQCEDIRRRDGSGLHASVITEMDGQVEEPTIESLLELKRLEMTARNGPNSIDGLNNKSKD